MALSPPEPAPRPGAAAFVAVPLLYLLGAAIGSRLMMEPAGVAVLWPANAVLVAALVRYRGRGWWAFALAAIVAEVVVDLWTIPIPEALVFGGANVVEASIAWLLLQAWHFDPRFERVADVGRFVLAGPVVAALVGAVTGTVFLTAVTGHDGTFSETVQVWWLGDALGLLVFTPLLLSFWVGGHRHVVPFPSRPLADLAMVVGGVATMGLLAGTDERVVGMHLRPVLLLPFVLYAAVRLPFRWVCVVVMTVALTFVALTVSGRSPYGGADPSPGVLWTQDFVLVMSVLSLAISTLLTNVRIGEEELRVANRQLRQRAAALEQSNADLRRIAFVTAHDLQTPLRSISSFTQLLGAELHGRLGPAAEDWIRRVIDNTRRLEALLRGLGKLAEVDVRDKPFEPVDLGLVFDQVVLDIPDMIRDAGASLSRDVLPVVLGDPEQLAQLLRELLCNAIKYRAAAPPTVHASARALLDDWEISVRDNGIGIPSDAHAQVFELFQRLPSPDDVSGTGVGLALCARVVHRHGGRIWIESEPGAGCTVRFTLPRQEASA